LSAQAERLASSAPDVTLFTSPLFRGASAALVSSVVSGSETRDLAAGDALLRVGSPNDDLFVVVSGSLSVYLPGVEQPLLSLAAGDCAGEISVLDGQSVSADVVANEQTVVLAIDREQLWRLLDESDAIARNLLRILAGRVRSDDAVIGESSRQKRHLEQLATVDQLTGLRNRRWLDDAFERQLARAVRTGQAMSVMMLDIDHFKRLNDTHGHACGDAVLRRVAQTLADGLRPQDLAARYGGEEFAVLLPGINEENAVAIAERIREAVQEEGAAAGPPVTVSIGIASRSGDQPLTALLERADEALYRAKNTGRNRTAV
jgi:diguanylate cyclase (GGDEF)-like protein